MKATFKILLLNLIALASFISPSHAVPSIDNRTSISGAIGSFGTNSAEAFGQVFIPTGPETVLDSFTLSLGRRPSSVVSFQAFVQQFDTTTQTSVGNILFTSAVFTTSLGNFDYEEFLFNTGGLQLTANTTYLAYLSVGLLPETGTSTSMPFLSPAPSNPNLGPFYFTYSESFDSSTGYVGPVWGYAPSGQAAFSANFSDPSAAVPEIDASAATLPLAAALIALLIIADRRQRLAT